MTVSNLAYTRGVAFGCTKRAGLNSQHFGHELRHMEAQKTVLNPNEK